jgi:hypothetical protein
VHVSNAVMSEKVDFVLYTGELAGLPPAIIRRAFLIKEENSMKKIQSYTRNDTPGREQQGYQRYIIASVIVSVVIDCCVIGCCCGLSIEER